MSTERVTLALLVGEWLKLAIEPLEWCHIYAPVVPQSLALELLQCPAPYILGIMRRTLQSARAVPPRDAVIVDLDSNTVRVPPGLQDILPVLMGLTAMLVPVLQPHCTASDSVNVPSGDVPHAPYLDCTVTICRSYLDRLLSPLSKCVVALEASEELLVACDEEKYIRRARTVLLGKDPKKDAQESADLFLRQIIRSQSFSEHILTIVAESEGKKM